MRAYGLDLPFAIGVVVFLIVQVGTAVPNAPANVGSYQLLTVLGLTLFGVRRIMKTAINLDGAPGARAVVSLGQCLEAEPRCSKDAAQKEPHD
jgi:hypothetical protein